MFRNLLLLALFAIAISSCSDDNNTNPTIPSDNLMVGQIGSYWIYNNYTLDSANNRVSTTHDSKDSVVYVRNEQKLGKNARVHTFYRWADGWPETGADNNFVYDDKKIYIHSDLINFYFGLEDLPIDLPIDIDEQWLLIGDPNGTVWDIYTKTLNDTTLTIPNYADIVLKTITLKVNGAYKKTEKVNVKGTTYDAHKFEVTLSITGKAEIMDIPVDLTMSRKIYMFFGNNIGNVRNIVEAMRYEIPGIGPGIYPGFEAFLIDYMILENTIQ